MVNTQQHCKGSIERYFFVFSFLTGVIVLSFLTSIVGPVVRKICTALDLDL